MGDINKGGGEEPARSLIPTMPRAPADSACRGQSNGVVVMQLGRNSQGRFARRRRREVGAEWQRARPQADEMADERTDRYSSRRRASMSAGHLDQRFEPGLHRRDQGVAVVNRGQERGCHGVRTRIC